MWDRWRTWTDKYAVSFFQSAEWAETLVRHYPFYRPEPILGDSYFLPLIRHRRWGWLSDSLYGMPFMTTGGILAEPSALEDAWESALAALRRKQVGTLVLNLPSDGSAPKRADGFELREEFTHLIDLADGWEAVHSRFKKSCKEAIRRAERLGVKIFLEDEGEGLDIHWSLILEQFEKWNPSPVPTRDFLGDLVRLPQSRLYIARIEDRPILSLLAFVQGGEIFLWQSAKVERDFPPGSANLLTFVSIQDACRDGLRTLNFGGSLGDARIENYKEAYGAVKTPFSILRRVHPLVKVTRIWKNPLGRTASSCPENHEEKSDR